MNVNILIEDCESCGGTHYIEPSELYALRIDYEKCIDEIKICCPTTGKSMVLHTDK